MDIVIQVMYSDRKKTPAYYEMILRGGPSGRPSGRGTLFVDFKFKVPVHCINF